MFRRAIFLGLLLLATTPGWSATLEIPTPNTTHSGIGVITGWKCNVGNLTIRFDDGPTMPLLHGSERGDTQSICGDRNNGFVSIMNWNNLSSGQHTAVVYDNGVEFDRATFYVASPGTAFLTDVSGTTEVTLSNGFQVRLEWDQAKQGFVITEYVGDTGAAPGSFDPLFFHYEWAAPWGGPSHQELREWLEPTYDLLLDVFDKTETLYPIELLRWGGPYITMGERHGEPTYQISMVSHDKEVMTEQFAHEITHALTNVFLEHPLQHRWFEETIADLAVMYTVQEYANDTPYDDFSEAQWMEVFRERDEEHQATLVERGIDPHSRVASWFRQHYGALQEDSTIRELNWAIGKELLPHFQANPELWIPLGYLNTWDAYSDATFVDFLNSWKAVLVQEGESTVLIFLLQHILYGN